MSVVPRSVRTFNPGAMNYGPFAKAHGAIGTDGRLAIFPDEATGYGAMSALLDSYAKRGLNSVSGIINRWAPRNVDNNSTDAYIRTVSSRLGVDPNQPLAAEHRDPLMKAMAAYEAGTGGAPSFPKSSPQRGQQPMPQMPGFAPMLPPQQEEQGNWLSNLTSNPLFLMGASVLGSRDVGSGLMSGAQAANAMALQKSQLARQNRKDQQEAMLFPYQLQALQQKASGIEPRPWWAGSDGSVDPAMMAKTLAGRQQTNIANNMPPIEKEYDKELGKGYAKQWQEINAEGAKSELNRANLKLVDQFIRDPNVYMGTGGELAQSVKKAMQSVFGTKVEGVASGELIQKLGKEIGLQYKDKLPGPMSDSDRKFLVDLPPNLNDSPEAAAALVQIKLAEEEWKGDRARGAREYAKANGGRLDAGWEPIASEINARAGGRMSEALSGLRAKYGSALAPRRPTAGTPLDVYKDRYGIELGK